MSTSIVPSFADWYRGCREDADGSLLVEWERRWLAGVFERVKARHFELFDPENDPGSHDSFALIEVVGPPEVKTLDELLEVPTGERDETAGLGVRLEGGQSLGQFRPPIEYRDEYREGVEASLRDAWQAEVARLGGALTDDDWYRAGDAIVDATEHHVSDGEANGGWLRSHFGELWQTFMQSAIDEPRP